MKRVGIIGAAGYTAGELLRLLQNHPEAKVVFAQSCSHAGQPVWKAHNDLVGETELTFSAEVNAAEADVIFLCSGHGKSKAVVAELLPDFQGLIIDLSNDFRLKADAGDFVYALPEAFRSDIRKTRHLANPGCFATCIQLSLLPMAVVDLLTEIHITGITGSTGAGQKPGSTTHFSWRDNNMSIYKPFTHQHLGEVGETLHRLAPHFASDINFVPMRGNFSRGIITSTYFNCALDEQHIINIYKDYYRNEPFVHVIDENPDLKMVVNTNKCILNVKKYGKKAHVIGVIDNLLKGASGQAVQNMNIAFGLPETMGLRLKASKF